VIATKSAGCARSALLVRARSKLAIKIFAAVGKQILARLQVGQAGDPPLKMGSV
jgi:hypothetical protein